MFLLFNFIRSCSYAYYSTKTADSQSEVSVFSADRQNCPLGYTPIGFRVFYIGRLFFKEHSLGEVLCEEGVSGKVDGDGALADVLREREKRLV